MKRNLITYFLITLSLAIPSQLLLKSFQSSSTVTPKPYISYEQDAQMIQENKLLNQQQTILEEKDKKELDSKKAAAALNINSANQETKAKLALSRGGTGLTKPQPKTPEKPVAKNQPAKQTVSSVKTVTNKQGTNSSSIELLDWWKSGRTIFSIGTVAEVKDLYTGKTFLAKRTMGTNHADTEALTQKDTDIIKNIWGGFSWNRRPVILTIGGKKYAASMSAMPHAGIDSAPAYAVINNRSQGYGTGQNLDVIKNNGMDGHFDIHFLNSTRHKDGQQDPQHQTAILKAAGK